MKCPHQSFATLPAQLDHVCHWQTDTWALRRILRDKFRTFQESFRRFPRFQGGVRWPAGFPKPRTCSYCGSVHPEDAIELVRAGWEVEATTKSYKRYLNPPRYRHLEPPVPPVKLYIDHFNAAQVEAFNAALRIRES